MLALGISGSPRMDSLSTSLLLKALETCKPFGFETEHIDTAKIKISACTGCSNCHNSCSCKLNDGMEKFFSKITSCDFCVISSPVYFYSITAQLKKFIDRCQPLWVKKFIKGEKHRDFPAPCLFIATAGGQRTEKLFESSENIIKVFCNSCDMVLAEKVYISGTDKLPSRRLEHFTEKTKEKTLNIIDELR